MDFKAAREKLELNQAQMARACGVHRQTWVKWERGEREPSRATLKLMSLMLALKKDGVIAQYI